MTVPSAKGAALCARSAAVCARSAAACARSAVVCARSTAACEARRIRHVTVCEARHGVRGAPAKESRVATACGGCTRTRGRLRGRGW